jgi:hypothetical protein
MVNDLSWLMRLFIAVCVSAILTGCSLSNLIDNPLPVNANANGKPSVWDCSLVQMSSPPRYACSDNKTYTASELRAARLDTEESKGSSK